MAQKKPRDDPKVGRVFQKRYKGCLYQLTIVTVSGGVGYKVGDEVFRTPSGAAESITGCEVNGWKWWGIED
jgi:hypothetical protein